MDIINKSRNYAVECHTNVNHYYGQMPYIVHLADTARVGERFVHLIPDATEKKEAIAACWTHDTIEDARQNYNDVKNATNQNVAEITYALTEEKGKTRKERHNSKYFKGIRETKNATFVKLCDIIANVENAKATDSKLLEMYKKEFPRVYVHLYEFNYDVGLQLNEMFQYLRHLLEI